MRLLSQFAVCQAEQENTGHDDVFDNFESPRKKVKKAKSSERIVIPTLNQVCVLYNSNSE